MCKIEIVRKGHHYSSLKVKFDWFHKEYQYCYVKEFTFDDTARYKLIGDDQHDVNKLFGISYGLNNHKNSDRIGWRYDPENDYIELVLYSYNNKKRYTHHLAYIEINQKYEIELRVTFDGEGHRSVSVWNGFNLLIRQMYVEPTPFIPILYTQNLYFGGNCKAPQDIAVKVYKDEYSKR